MSSNLYSMVKEAETSPSEKMIQQQGFIVAVDQILEDALLTKKDLEAQWSEYCYLVDSRSGSPYDHIPLRLPRYAQTFGDEKEWDVVKVKNCTFAYSRMSLYQSKKFQFAIRDHYRKLGYSVRFITLRKGILLKIYTLPKVNEVNEDDDTVKY